MTIGSVAKDTTFGRLNSHGDAQSYFMFPYLHVNGKKSFDISLRVWTILKPERVWR